MILTAHHKGDKCPAECPELAGQPNKNATIWLEKESHDAECNRDEEGKYCAFYDVSDVRIAFTAIHRDIKKSAPPEIFGQGA
jgi:hypothetical protein